MEKPRSGVLLPWLKENKQRARQNNRAYFLLPFESTMLLTLRQ